jgi:hypothetical protein
MKITEQEKKDILSKYIDNTSDELLNHLKRTYPVVEFNVSWKSEPIKAIIIDQKTRFIDGNKKFLVGKLTNILENDWSHLGEPLIRRTIKKYIDGISI